MFRPVQVINNCVISASGRSGLLLKLDIIKKAIGVFLLIVSIPYGVVAIALSLLLTNLIATVINVFPNRKILGYGYREQFKDIWDNLLIAMIMGGFTYLLTFLDLPYIAVLILQIGVGVGVYWSLSVLFKNKSYMYLKGLMISFINKTIATH